MNICVSKVPSDGSNVNRFIEMHNQNTLQTLMGILTIFKPINTEVNPNKCTEKYFQLKKLAAYSTITLAQFVFMQNPKQIQQQNKLQIKECAPKAKPEHSWLTLKKAK